MHIFIRSDAVLKINGYMTSNNLEQCIDNLDSLKDISDTVFLVICFNFSFSISLVD